MEKIIKFSYDKNSDELNLNLGNPKDAILLEIGDEIYARLNPRTKEVIGFTILHFEKRASIITKRKTLDIPLVANFKPAQRIKELVTSP